MHAGRELVARDNRCINIGQPPTWMLGKNVPAAGLTPLAITARGLVVGTDVCRALGNAQSIGLPERERIYRPGGPATARVAMAITRRDRRTGYHELHGSAKTRSGITGLSIHF